MKLTMATLCPPRCSLRSPLQRLQRKPRTVRRDFGYPTKNTISDLRLAPAGTTNWGPDQCKNDKDGSVETDEGCASPA